MCLKRIFFVLLFFIFYEFIYAQTGDTLRTADTTLYVLNHSSTGIINYTNESRSYLLNNLLKFNIIRKRISINTANGWVYGSQLTGLTNNDFTSAVDVNLFKAVQKFYYWGVTTYDKSFSLKINNRLQTGAGVGYNLFAKPNFNIILSDGILYERTSLYDTTTYSTIRNSFRIKYHIVIAKIITLEGTNFLQQSFVQEKDYIIKCMNSISFKLKNWLSLTVSTTYNKINISKNENFLCNIGLNFQKTFTRVRVQEE
jgi:hypothetical protein